MVIHHILSGDALTLLVTELAYTGDNVSGDIIESIGELDNGGSGAAVVDMMVVVKISASGTYAECHHHRATTLWLS